jgi:pimeloyl-ACP methyl ester carboxylesterase
MTRMVRRFLDVEGRRVHLRTTGHGPPLVMLHGSPADSQLLVGEMAAAAGDFTCIALDTPGFGFSDALPGETLIVRDLAAATVAAMHALGLPPCPVYGTHTGAAIALEIGAGWPQCVTGLVIDALPIFNDEEIAYLFVDEYFSPMVPDPLGGHLFRTWMRFRDQFTWFPWFSRDATRLNPLDRPTAAEIDLWVTMFYRSCRTYRSAYRAACHYGAGALRAVTTLAVPAVFLASAEDMLYPHLERLPALKRGQRVERLAYDPAAKNAAIIAFAKEMRAGYERGKHPVPTSAARPAVVGSNPGLQFVDTPHGQVFVRFFGDRQRPALFLLHDAPGTGLSHVDMATALAARYWLIVPDLPGNGYSDPPPEASCSVEASALAVLAIADALGVAQFSVAGIGCGGAVAAAVARQGDARLNATCIGTSGATPLPDPDVVAPELALAPEGTHWLKAWLMLRDAQVYMPWYDGRVQAQRRRQGNFDAQWLHDQTCALMASRETYHWLARAAAAWRPRDEQLHGTNALLVVEAGDLVQTLLFSNPLPEMHDERPVA